MFKSIIRAHTEMILNPFFEPFDRVDEEDECFEQDDENNASGNQMYIDIFKKKLDDIALLYDKYFWLSSR